MAKTKASMEKVAWSGRLLAVQPRIRLTRSYDERHHSYHGYVLRVDETCRDETGEFLVAVGKRAQEKHQFGAGMELSGLSVPVDDPRLEVAGFYKTSLIKVDKDADVGPPSAPPFNGVPPRPSTPGHDDLRIQVLNLYVGLQDAGRNYCRPLESFQEEVPL